METKEKVIEVMKLVIPEEHLQSIFVEDFVEECMKMIQLYAKKNHDYGNSFNKGMDDIGIKYGIGRLYDKMNRIINLTNVEAEIKDESIEDTIRDLACYSVMTSVYLNVVKGNKIADVDFEGNDSNISSMGEL